MSAIQPPAEQEGSPQEPSPFMGALRKEVIKRIARWIVGGVILLLILLLLTGIIPLLRCSLGIDAIEEHLHNIERDLSATEDTIFTYKYDYAVPRYNALKKALVEMDFAEDKIPALLSKDFFDSLAIIERRKSKLKNEITQQPPQNSNTRLQHMYLQDFAALKDLIEKAYQQLHSPVKRTFYFSAAAEHTESTLYYELTCLSPQGTRLLEPVSFHVKVNNYALDAYNDWEGRHDLSISHLSKNESISTVSNHQLYKQTLSLELFGSEDSDQRNFDIKRILGEQIDRCSFDVMIFVRDIPPTFEREDMMLNLLGKMLSQ